ncbi:hypothetical protein KY348_05625 [Candidatus Woesearchaeota archaeon]|nr:hypothetical protein [Candidatus Woesearchaeota archaeon]
MVKNHIKRINAPRNWNIFRKRHAFITRPNPGRDLSLSVSLNTVLKELLNKTKTTKESKHLIKKQGVFVNGKRRYDYKFPVGFLDIVSFPGIKEHYRLMVNEKNKLFMLEISDEESKLKLSKILNKKQLQKGRTQINFTDGRNITVGKDSEILKQARTNDCVLYTVPGQKAKQVLKLEKGALVYLYKGKHTGLLVVVDEFDRDNIVFKLGKDIFETKKAYAFVVGKEKPVITLGKK